MNDMRSLHVVNALGPVARLQPHRGDPQGDAQLSGRPRVATTRRRSSATSSLPFPRAAQVEGPDKDASWLAQDPDGSSPDGWQWADLYSLNQQIVGDATDPYEIALRLEQVPAADLHLHAEAAGERLLLALRRLPLRHPRRILPAFRRGDGDAPPLQRGAGTGGGRLRHRRAGITRASTRSPPTTPTPGWRPTSPPSAGWPFDPTPGRSLPNAGASSTSPGFKDPFASDPSGQSHADHRHRAYRPTQQDRAAAPTGQTIGSELDQRRPLAALGARRARAAGRLAARQEAVAGEGSAAGHSGPALRRLTAAAARRPLRRTGWRRPAAARSRRCWTSSRLTWACKPRPGPGRPRGRRPVRRPAGHGRGLRAGRGVPPGGGGAAAQAPRMGAGRC